jgi:hypothetical protein
VAQAVAGRRPALDIERLNARRFADGQVTTDRSVV